MQLTESPSLQADQRRVILKEPSVLISDINGSI